MSAQTVCIRKTVRSNSAGGRLPQIPFEKIARSILGARYELSLVLCGDALATRMNRTHRKKQYSPNVLSFTLSKYEGEIFLNVRAAGREAKHYNAPLRRYLMFLFIHACFHLKGLYHGTRMERAEASVLRKFL